MSYADHHSLKVVANWPHDASLITCFEYIFFVILINFREKVGSLFLSPSLTLKLFRQISISTNDTLNFSRDAKAGCQFL